MKFWREIDLLNLLIKLHCENVLHVSSLSWILRTNKKQATHSETQTDKRQTEDLNRVSLKILKCCVFQFTNDLPFLL